MRIKFCKTKKTAKPASQPQAASGVQMRVWCMCALKKDYIFEISSAAGVGLTSNLCRILRCNADTDEISVADTIEQTKRVKETR